ncbi:hypothetical protein LEMLEM_LOCUS12368 [Lemmus lemmus]
MTGTQD